MRRNGAVVGTAAPGLGFKLPLFDLYAKFGTLDAAVNQVVSPIVNQQVKIVFGHYTAVKAIQERGNLNTEIKNAIADSLKYDPMIIIEAVQLENIEFSPNYLHSIE